MLPDARGRRLGLADVTNVSIAKVPVAVAALLAVGIERSIEPTVERARRRSNDEVLNELSAKEAPHGPMASEATQEETIGDHTTSPTLMKMTQRMADGTVGAET